MNFLICTIKSLNPWTGFRMIGEKFSKFKVLDFPEYIPKKTVPEEKQKFQTATTAEDWSNLVLDIEQRMKKMIRGEGEEGWLHDSAREVCEQVLKQMHDAKMKMLTQ